MKIDQKLINDIQKKFKDIRVGPDEEGLKVLSTGSLYLDIITGCGGWPCGKVCTLVGKASSGKSTISMLSMANAANHEKRVVYIDCEESFDAERAEHFGLKHMENMLLIRSKTLEEAGEVLIKLVVSNEVDLVIFDSIGGASIKALEEGDVEDHLVGRKAKIMSHIMMKLVGPLGFNKTGLIFIQQWRDSFNMYEPYILAGGKAYEHANQMTVQLTAKNHKELKDGTLIITAQVRKNKVAVAGKKCSFHLYPGGIIDREEEIADILTDNENLAYAAGKSDRTFMEAMGVERTGSWYTLPEEWFGSDNKFQGSNKIIERLKAEPDLKDKIESNIYKNLTRGAIRN